MSQNDILSLIDAEIAHLKQARALIAGAGKPGPGRPKSTAPVATPKPKRKKLSKEGRARIAAAQVARWAAIKKKAVK
jgi:hypothetical protein